jgi:hypothetical protein
MLVGRTGASRTYETSSGVAAIQAETLTCLHWHHPC